MSLVSNEKGASRIKTFLIFVLLFLVIHVAVKLVPMYMSFYRFEDEMKMKAGVAQVLKDVEIQKDLVTKAKELDLPQAAIDNLKLERFEEERKMKISTQWDTEINFLWGTYLKTYSFAPLVEENFMSMR